MSDPTPEEIARVRAYERAKGLERAAKNMAEREAKIVAYVQRANELVGETITAVEVEDFDQYGDVRGEREVKLTFASGRTLRISDQGWDERYWAFEVTDGD